MTDNIPAKHLRVAINAQIIPGKGFGGVELVLIGLINALGKLDGPEEYIIITPWQDPGWIEPYTGPNQIVAQAPKIKNNKYLKKCGRLLGPLKPYANKLYHYIARTNEFSLPVSDGFYEQLGADLIHFPYQEFVKTSLPSIYNPHDLQHLHYPNFFPEATLKWRGVIYPAGCNNSKIVVAGSRWVKKDLISNFKIDPDKIQVIPWAPPTSAFELPSTETIREVKHKYQLFEHFAFYPAMTWEHKNHIKLLEALAYLRDHENFIVNVICTGNKTDQFFPKIMEKLEQLNLTDQVKFLGIIPHSELRAVYKLSQFVIVPTLFEAASAPVFEAWQEGIPVACSTVTSLPEQAGTAAFLFDPYSIEDIAEALKLMSTDKNLLKKLKESGAERLKDFSWERTAKAYRAVYRFVAGRQLSDEDKKLLDWDWMRDPKQVAEEI